MIKIEVENLENGRKFGGRFESMELAEAWIQEQTTKPSLPWGKAQRLVKESNMSEWEKTRVLSKEKNSEGEWVCTVKPDYEITIWKDQAYQEKRALAYPSQMELLEAILENMENRPQKLQQVLAKREMVRKAHPKDERELLEKR